MRRTLGMILATAGLTASLGSCKTESAYTRPADIPGAPALNKWELRTIAISEDEAQPPECYRMEMGPINFPIDLVAVPDLAGRQPPFDFSYTDIGNDSIEAKICVDGEFVDGERWSIENRAGRDRDFLRFEFYHGRSNETLSDEVDEIKEEIGEINDIIDDLVDNGNGNDNTSCSTPGNGVCEPDENRVNSGGDCGECMVDSDCSHFNSSYTTCLGNSVAYTTITGICQDRASPESTCFGLERTVATPCDAGKTCLDGVCSAPQPPTLDELRRQVSLEITDLNGDAVNGISIGAGDVQTYNATIVMPLLYEQMVGAPAISVSESYTEEDNCFRRDLSPGLSRSVSEDGRIVFYDRTMDIVVDPICGEPCSEEQMIEGNCPSEQRNESFTASAVFSDGFAPADYFVIANNEDY